MNELNDDEDEDNDEDNDDAAADDDCNSVCAIANSDCDKYKHFFSCLS